LSASRRSALRSGEGGAAGQPRVQPRLAHGARSDESVDRVRSDRALGGVPQGEPRRAFRADFPDKSEDFGRINTAVRRGSDGEMLVDSSRPPIRDDLQAVIDEQQKA
jgi:hypothetical protein